MATTRRLRPRSLEPEPLDPTAAVLLELPVDGPGWSERLPPVPEGAAATMSFSSATVHAEQAHAVELLGYRVVGVDAAPTSSEPAAQLLLNWAFARAHPGWWGVLLDAAWRAYDLAFGPVRARFAETLRLHLTDH